MSNELVAQILARRESRLELAKDKSVVLRRPSEYDLSKVSRESGLDFLLRYVVGWSGYTEADLIGAEVGSDQVVLWDPEVFAAYICDRAVDIQAIDKKLSEMISAYNKQREAIAKN